MNASASIQATLSRWLAVQTLVALSLVCTVIYAATHWSFSLKQQDELSLHADNILRLSRDSLKLSERALLRLSLEEYLLAHPNMTTSLWSNGRKLYSSGTEPAAGRWITQHWTVPDILVDGKPVEMIMGLDIGADKVLLRRLAITLIATAALGTVAASLTAALLVRRGLRPLTKLAKETGIAGPTHPGHRIDPRPYAAELRPWILQFNGLLERVENAYIQLEAFNADVAHELRTPLSNMIAQTEIVLGRDRSKEELKDTLESQLEEARRLAAIVSDMLFLSKADRGQHARRGAARSLAQQVYAVADYQEVMIEDAQLSLAVTGEARLAMDTALVRRAISNLLSNAIRHATPQSTIRVAIEDSPNQVTLYVENFGPTITPTDLPRLFERFYRGDRSRTGSSNHHGLGLAIVAGIARMHGGSTFASSRDGLTRVGFTLLNVHPSENPPPVCEDTAYQAADHAQTTPGHRAAADAQ